MAEPNISGSNSGGGSLGDSSTPVVGTGKSGFGSVIKEAEQFKRVLGGITAGMEKLTDASRKAGAAIKGTMGGRGSGHKASLASGYNAPMSNGSADDDTSKPGYMSRTIAGAGRLMSGGGSGGGSAGGGGGGAPSPWAGRMDKFAGGLNAIGSLVGAGVATMDARIARGYAYSSSADKMSVMYQQITGLSNAGVRNAYRQPLTNYRLGENGINTLLGMQASTGIGALNQASSAEGLNALSGYSLGTQGVANMLTNMGSAQTANRMFMTTGMSLYKPGGGQRTGTELIQNLARASGLTGLKNIEGALQQGSNTRARLSDMGVDTATQDLVIQYAMANKQYGAKGGKGMYDPSDKNQRRMVGIENNFATQIEETTRVKTNREEDFYGTQQASFAKLEEATQSLEKMFGRLEERMSGIIGKGIETKSKRGMWGGVLKSLGPVMSMAGIAAMAIPGIGTAAGVGLMAAGAAATATGAAIDPAGDPGPGRNLPTMGRTGDPSTSAKTSKLHPTMRQRVEQLVAASGGKVGIGQAYRSKADQESMFRSRYRKTSSPTDKSGNKNWQWDGSYWEHVSGAQAAPPGRSMHEIGLAVDLTGDMGWISANAARFGLKNFTSLGEPWHVQPSELPGGRSEYEKMGRPWGGEPMSSSSGGSGDSEHGKGNKHLVMDAGISVFNLKGMSMSDSIAAFRAGGALGSTGLSGGAGSKVRSTRSGGSVSGSGSTFTGAFNNGGMARSGVDIKQWSTDFLNRVGAPVTASNLEAMSAWIASEGTRAAYNPLAVKSAPTDPADVALGQWSKFNNEGSGVKNFASYEQGLRMNVFHMQNYGKRVINALKSSSNDPYAVAESVNKMYASWGGNKVMADVLKSRGIPMGTAQTGDPMPRMANAGGGSTTFKSGSTFNIAPIINVNSSGNSYVDAEVIAREVTMILEREIRIKELRMA
jgi:hypothetical protein